MEPRADDEPESFDAARLMEQLTYKRPFSISIGSEVRVNAKQLFGNDSTGEGKRSCWLGWLGG